MIQGNYIMVREFCAHHHLSVDFMQKLEERGMIEISRIETEEYLPVTAISHLEKMVRLHQELEIHPEDLDVVCDLLERIASLQEELDCIRRRLLIAEQLQ
ncbi:MAG TPA: chaperone modulator CbpM [Edaphocola sp.]|nr:chaperone modulator CbpM [Edaphocola sp.]